MGGDAATIEALDGMSPLSLALSTLPRALLLVATSLVLLRSQMAPRWVGWTGLALTPDQLREHGRERAGAKETYQASGDSRAEDRLLCRSARHRAE